ncbi:hypothetical protein H5410_018484 [Solanum commersonii]|uniref:Uncharacterized protein n=1 Tax=Solanum commersonii TaxID=4109 RepID=A0A9J6A395_SOLCO|nr:hypothetical protein H5410_018484 [Solanum commersonii]
MKIGNIFEKSQQLEKEAEQSEEKYMKSMDPIDRINMNRIKAELITHHKHIHRIKVDENWIEGDDNIGIAAVEFYHDLFSEGKNMVDNSLLDLIPNCISEQDNQILIRDPTTEEIKQAVKQNIEARCRLPEEL